MKPNQLRSKNRKGFALIVTLILLMLITVIAIGLLSLSSTSLRASGTALARSQAQANARMALSLAIGQLQSTAGLDKRITASADILSDSSTAPSETHKGWYGVWESDESTPNAFPDGRPDKFVDWLVTSSGETGNTRLAEMMGSNGNSTAIRVINGTTDGEVQIPLIETLENGRLGWWTEDESTKARANLPKVVKTEIGDKLVALHGSARPQPEGLTSEITGFDPTASQMAGLVTPAQLPLGATQWPDGGSKDFTTYAQSLIVNVKDGGFKKDLTTLFELPYANIPKDKYGYWYGNSPRKTIEDENSYIYGAPQVTVGARWSMLYNYYNLYKEITVGTGGVPSITPKPNLVSWTVTNGPIPNDPPELMGDQLAGYRTPRVSQIAYSFCYWIQTATGGYVPHIGFRTYVSLWNPFDTAINFPSTASFGAKIYAHVPIRISATTTPSVATMSPTEPTTIFNAGGAGIRRFSAPGTGSSTLSLAPGENAIFSYNATTGLYTKGFDPGPNSILYQTTLPSLQVTAAQRNARINFSVQGKEGAEPPTGGSGSNSNFSQYSDIWIQALSGGGYEKRGDLVTINTTNFASMMPIITLNGTRSYLQLQQSAEKVELATFVVKTKATKEKASNSTLLSAPNLHTGITRMSSLMAGTQVDALTGLYEYAMDLGINGRDLIGAASGDQQSFIGYAQSSGINYYAPISLPKVPPTSLAQFRHAGLGDGAALVSANMGNGKTLIPSYIYTGDFAPGPHADQSIGNSYAHPLIPKGQTETNSPYPNMKYYDHRYLGNEALWDEYFLSSLAPRDSKFGDTKSASDSWQELVGGQGKLINPRFSAYLSGETSEESESDLFNGATLRNDAYEKIASKLMLEGGFNVNSTSVRAWRAMLSSTRGDALMRSTGGGDIVNPNKAFYSRTEFVREEGVDDQPGDIDRHFNGFRELDDAQITTLAERIVEQVRLRGPFLNVAQFINRRLSGEDRMTLAGPLQTAIDESGLNDSIESSGMSPDTISGLAYPAAAREPRTTAVGIPGWLMQGDILDPLGPSIVVRGDTFRIRAYGEARSPSDEVLSRAWCEAVVQRVPSFVDASEPAYSTPTKTVNEEFGRRFEIVQFRWLSGPDDI